MELGSTTQSLSVLFFCVCSLAVASSVILNRAAAQGSAGTSYMYCASSYWTMTKTFDLCRAYYQQHFTASFDVHSLWDCCSCVNQHEKWLGGKIHFHSLLLLLLTKAQMKDSSTFTSYVRLERFFFVCLQSSPQSPNAGWTANCWRAVM